MKTIRLYCAVLALLSFTVLPQARAICQEGCLTNENTALGDDALVNNTSGSENTATGFQALFSNTIGNSNTAAGSQALFSNTSGGNNTANGREALFGNTTGNNNTATGLQALLSNTTGFSNTATGALALGFNLTGNSNTATGFSSLENNTVGSKNTAVGLSALQNNTTGSFNIALGFSAGTNVTTGKNNIDIGNAGVAGESRTIRVGTKPTHLNAYIAGISGVTVPGGVGVIIDRDGHLGTVVSSARFKEKIQPMDKASEAVLALKPVTFRYKHGLDPAGIPQFGLVAEQVEKVDPDLVARDDEGKPYTVRYEAVNAMLLNEFLKEHRKVEEQGAEIAELKATLAKQAAQIQMVSDQLRPQALAPRVVAND